MKRDGYTVVARVMNPVKTNVVGDVSDFVHPKCLRRLDREWLRFCTCFWGVVHRFVELSRQDLHDAMGIGMVVNRRALARVPDQKQLFSLGMRIW